MGNVTIDSKRDYGIDLLRILSMLMVVATHALGEGGLLEAAIGHTSHTAFVWLTEAGVACAVNVYGLISGYVGYSARHRPANLLYLWCQAVFYTLGFTVLLKWGQGLALGDILAGLCPVTKRTYWYLTAYFALFFLMPALNFLIRTLPKKELLLLNASCVFLFSLMPSILESDLFFTKDGYSCLWLAVLYLLGGTCRRLELFHKTSVIRALGVYLLCCFVNLIGRDVFLKYRMFDRMYRLFEYTAPLVLVSAIALLAAFAGRKLPGFAVPFVKKGVAAGIWRLLDPCTSVGIWQSILWTACAADPLSSVKDDGRAFPGGLYRIFWMHCNRRSQSAAVPVTENSFCL